MTTVLAFACGYLLGDRARLRREVRRGERFVAGTIRSWVERDRLHDDVYAHLRGEV